MLLMGVPLPKNEYTPSQSNECEIECKFDKVRGNRGQPHLVAISAQIHGEGCLNSCLQGTGVRVGSPQPMVKAELVRAT